MMTMEEIAMEDERKKQVNFVGYEYKEVLAEGKNASFLIDGYENFGWELDENLSGKMSSPLENTNLPYQKKIIVRLKRNRKIVNKMELTRLQRNFEACIDEINKLEGNKTSKATVYALVLGILGTAFMAGATFAVTAQPPHIILCILLSIPGFIGWILPYFLYKKLMEKQVKRMTPLIEEKYDEIYEICEKGNRLIY